MISSQMRVHIRWMIRRDMAEVLQIEKHSFEDNWIEEDFLCCLRQRYHIGMVAEHREEVVGFMIYQLRETSLRILNFAVHPLFRRIGVGGHMVTELVSKLSTGRRTCIFLHLRENNLSAQLFFRSQNFRVTKIIKRSYKDSGEDGYLMQYKLKRLDQSRPTYLEDQYE